MLSRPSFFWRGAGNETTCILKHNLFVIVFCVGVSKAPPVLYLSYSTRRRYLCSLRYLLCTYAYNKLLMGWEGVLYAEYSMRGGVERTIQQEANSLKFVTLSIPGYPCSSGNDLLTLIALPDSYTFSFHCIL